MSSRMSPEMRNRGREQAGCFENTQANCIFIRRRQSGKKALANFINYLKGYFWLFIFICPLLLPYHSFPEIIDRIVAVVNDKVITLTDLRIVKEFGLYDKEVGESDQNLDRLILEKMIDQKLVVQIAGEQVSAGKEELDSFLKKLAEEMGSEKLHRRLEEFGMDWDALKGYVEERVEYQKIILQRFGQRNIVSLKDMEDYYQRVYVPSQQKKGLEPRPMMDILAEIESSIKQDKIKAQVEAWIKSLRKRADIQLHEF